MQRAGWIAAACALFAVGCGGDDSGGEESVTYDTVSEQINWGKNCSGAACHSSTAGGFALAAPDALYATLTTAEASGMLCAGSGYKLVVPGEPDESLLYLKLLPDPPCGDPMPASASTLPEETIETVRVWIESGAER